MGSSLRHRLPAAARRATRVAGPALAALLLAAPTPAAAAGPVAAALAASSAGGGRVVEMRARLAEAARERIAQLRTLRDRFVERAHAATGRMGFARRVTPALVERSTSALQALRLERGTPTLRGLLGATLAVRGLTRALRSPVGRATAARQPTQLARPLKPLARLMVRPEGIRANAVARTAQRLLLRPAALRLFRLPVLREVAQKAVARELAVALRLEARMLGQENADPAALARASDAVRAARALLQTIDGTRSAPLAAGRSSAGRDSEDPLPHARRRATLASPARHPTGSRGALSQAGMEGFASAPDHRGPATAARTRTHRPAFAPGGSTPSDDDDVGVL